MLRATDAHVNGRYNVHVPDSLSSVFWQNLECCMSVLWRIPKHAHTFSLQPHLQAAHRYAAACTCTAYTRNPGINLHVCTGLSCTGCSCFNLLAVQLMCRPATCCTYIRTPHCTALGLCRSRKIFCGYYCMLSCHRLAEVCCINGQPSVPGLFYCWQSCSS